ncbi:signal peptidase I [Leuconostoc miyukkimchii]|uniref:signal peptidase I n=1 Tax=Leuconostoc miyukkimchii TaxID=910540 RepID=UPI001C7D6F3B|nr:signal peptidase I [Leuconostoc miyukkimchii]
MQNKFIQFLKEWVLPVVVAFIAVTLVRTFLFSFVLVNGSSMAPNLQNKELVVLSKISKYQHGDVIVFNAKHEDPRIRAGEKDYVKRIIGMPGDTVSYKNSNLYVNDKIINQDYIGINERTQGTEMSFGNDWSLKSLSSTNQWQKKDRNQTKVPAGEYFVMGDHRSVSNDGRYFGFVDKKHVTGKVIVPFWSSNQEAKQNINGQNKKFYAK